MTAKKTNSGFLKKVFRICLRVILILFVAHFIYLLLLKWIFPPVTITQLNAWISGDGLSQKNRSLQEISPEAALAVIAAEDQLFPQHNGFDWKSIERAIDFNEENPERVRGASTISQQTAKNVFLWQRRSWFRKGLEVYCTFMIEWIWGKQRILEVYLNVAQTGKGIFGMEAASRFYFNKSAAKLTSKEAARIAACLPNPERYSVIKPGAYVNRRTNWILRQMRNLRGDPPIQAIIQP